MFAAGRLNRIVLAAASATAAGVACSPYSPHLPESPFLCGSAEPLCPDGYTCEPSPSGGGSACVAPEGTVDAAPGACAFTGVLATWSFVGLPGTQPTTSAMSTAAGVMADSISRAPLLQPSSGTGSINSSNWPTSVQFDPTSFYTFGLTPRAGCALDVTSLAIDVKSSSSGPTSAAVGTSIDSFAQTTPILTTAPSTPTLSVTGASTTVEIRIFGYSANASTGTMRVENEMTVTGALH